MLSVLNTPIYGVNIHEKFRLVNIFICIKKLWSLMDRAQHRQVTMLFFWMLVGMGFEMLSLGLVIPAVSILMGVQEGASSIIGNLQMGDWFGSLSYSQLVYTGMMILLGAYIIKMLFLLFLAWKQVHFVFGIQQSFSYQLFLTYLYQPYVFHLKRNSSELIRNTVNDVNVLVHTGLKSVLSLVTENCKPTSSKV